MYQVLPEVLSELHSRTRERKDHGKSSKEDSDVVSMNA